ncbi:DUF2793 domain-containing protein [Shinella sp. JR1-6]|nr:DUF2793 domain-containing protein [Shinella sp. JR1-6]
MPTKSATETETMDASENLNLPYIIPAQAQKHVTHNEAIKTIDALLHLAVKSRSLASPPASPAAGDRYIVPAAATGAWAGSQNAIAAWQDAVWTFYQPREGWIAYAKDENTMLAFQHGAWTSATVNTTNQNRLGINTAADLTNRFAVAL